MNITNPHLTAFHCTVQNGGNVTEHLSRAFTNLEYRLLTEINHLRSMINMLLPPLYQQHYFAQPQPYLYQPLSMPSTNSTNVVKSTQVAPSENSSDLTENDSHQSNEIQNESPFAVGNPAASTDTPNQKETTTIQESSEATILPTEKQLEFKPVQKKPHERNKLNQK